MGWGGRDWADCVVETEDVDVTRDGFGVGVGAVWVRGRLGAFHWGVFFLSLREAGGGAENLLLSLLVIRLVARRCGVGSSFGGGAGG